MVKERLYTPDRGDVVWVDLNPAQGHEQKNTRPALVLSPRAYNKKTGLVLVVPITSQVKGYPFEVALTGKKVKGVVLADQLRTLDWRVRKVRYIERATDSTVQATQARILALVC